MKRNLFFDRKSPIYLGVGSNHDFSACIVQDGRIKYAIEAERINRIKHSVGAFNPFNSIIKYLFSENENKINSISTCDTLNMMNLYEYINNINLFNHHLCHAASVFFTSPFRSAAILVLDGAGSRKQLKNGNCEFETVSMYAGFGTDITLLKKITGIMGENIDEKHNHHLDIPNSLGVFFTYITKIVGFNFLDDGKTMGLASYGDENSFYEDLRKYVEFLDDGSVLIKLTDDKAYKYKAIIDREISNGEKFQLKADFAASGQKILEEIYFHYINLLYDLTKQENLCISGGVALNSLANGKIKNKSKFKNIYFFPACGDDAIAVGAAYLAYYADFKERFVNNNQTSFLGKNYSNKNILESLKKFNNIKYYKSDNKYKETANLLNSDKIIAWFQGKSEFGPRALGHRSILANPKNQKIKDYINKEIKQREFFRPFAPAVLYEYQKEYFESDDYLPYMSQVINIRKDKIINISAVAHIDNTARVQSVDKKNSELYKLLIEFYKISKLPVLLNTSFNIKDIPIVETPGDALNCFSKSHIDYLIMGDFICKRNK